MMLADLGLSLRPAGPDDRDWFYAVRRAGFLAISEATFGPWRDAVQRALAARDVAELPIEIAEHGGAAVGYLVVLHHPDHVFLDEIAVAPEARGRGFGAALVRHAMARAASAGVPLQLSVLTGNPVQRLYHRLGFAVTHIEPPRVKMSWTPGS